MGEVGVQYLQMQYFLLGLGNSGKEYENTRHNTGRVVLEHFRKKNDFPAWQEDKKIKALVSEGKVGKAGVLLVEPETFMNNSGKAAAFLVKTKKAAENLIVIHDDLDLPLGKIKISWNRGGGGHKGIESIKRAVKTEAFTRMRVGISPATAKGAAKKPSGEEAVIKFILGKFKPAEESELKKIKKKIAEAIEMIITEGKEEAMSRFN